MGKCLCDVTPCICGMSSKVVITRTSPGCYDENGRWVDGPVSNISIMASVQPLKSHEMIREPEGRRTSGSVKLYTMTQLQTADVQARRQPDKFTWHGKEYEVLSIDDWSEHDFFKVIAVEVGQ